MPRPDPVAVAKVHLARRASIGQKTAHQLGDACFGCRRQCDCGGSFETPLRQAQDRPRRCQMVELGPAMFIV